mmetsp:Transcript_2080/g.3006  ORF Transcript_2080/g.3006 Transcript_2080/m.3006 type:complete len:654 (-) Transcript_2080:1526-3487(-)
MKRYLLLSIILVFLIQYLSGFKSVDISKVNGINDNFITDSKTGYMEGLFWWLVPTESTETKPLVVWLNGGPGCSSMVGAVNENGPIQWVQEPKIFQKNIHSWHKEVNMLYIDNPVSTGFSEDGPIPTSATDAMKVLYKGLNKWINTNPHKFSDNDVFLFGESYGGKYVIELANLIRLNNQTTHIKLKGIGLGNAWVAPDLQSKYYAETGYQVNILNGRTLQDAKTEFQKCIKEQADKEENKEIIPPLTTCLNAWSIFVKGKDEDDNPVSYTNGYDYRKHSQYDWLTEVDFRNEMRNSVFDALKPNNKQFSICNNEVFQKMGPDFQLSYVDIIPKLLESEISVLAYNGQFDMRANVVGTNKWLSYLPWKGRGAFLAAQKKVFKVNDETKGIYRKYGKLHQLVMYNSGHMVPMDQPAASLEMIKRFTSKINLCADNENCDAEPLCPMQCSGHTNPEKPCKDSSCECNKHFNGNACENYENNNFLKESLSLTNSFIPGEFTHSYKIASKVQEGGNENLDIHIDLTRIADKKGVNGGRLYIFLHVGNEFLETQPTLDLMQRKFRYHTLSGSISSNLYANELNRKESSHITVVIWNDSPNDALYNIKIHPKTSGLKLNPLNVVSYVTFGLTAFATLALGVIFIAQYCFAKALYKFSKK